VADKKGIRRYGHAYVPLDEALSRVVIDLSGRPGFEYHVEYPRARIGEFDVDLVGEFFQGFINHALVTLHVDCLRGKNAHHIAETIFKAFGRALRMALEVDARTLHDMLARGRAAGIETRGISDHGFIHSIYFRDPNGYVIELTAKTPGHDEAMDPARNGARDKLDRWSAARRQRTTGAT